MRWIVAGCAGVMLLASARGESPPPSPSVEQKATTANPIATPTARAPIDIRRVTIVVRDIDTSLRLYRDALGMKVNYDQTMTVSGPAFAKGKPGRAIRLVLLNANDPWIGWIGLLQYTDPPLKPARRRPPREHDVGSHIIVTAVEDAAKACAAAQAAPGVRMAAPAKIEEYPGRDGGPPIRVLGCQIWDRDGAYLELNQRLP